MALICFDAFWTETIFSDGIIRNFSHVCTVVFWSQLPRFSPKSENKPRSSVYVAQRPANAPLKEDREAHALQHLRLHLQVLGLDFNDRLMDSWWPYVAFPLKDEGPDVTWHCMETLQILLDEGKGRGGRPFGETCRAGGPVI